MKKNYSKPTLHAESIALSSAITASCGKPGDFYSPLDMPIPGTGDWTTVFIESADCAYNENAFIAEYGAPYDGRCYVATTDDGRTFAS
ncbi:MAG: hypothetical protein IKZ82_03590 [Clostridia bacterium]|nr:hypothetical protein [Clostridia bacterium]